MQRLTGVYFQENFLEPPACKNQSLYYYHGTKIPGFITFIRRVQFLSHTEEDDYQYIASNCEKLREISFFYVEHDLPNATTFIDRIRDKLGDIEMINWYEYWPSIRFYEDFLKFCSNLKTLRLYVPRYTDQSQHEWMCHEYPKLEHVMLRLEITDDLGKKLSIFLQKNEQLQCIELHYYFLLKYSDIFINSSIRLKVLILHHNGGLRDGLFGVRFDVLNSLLNRLKDGGFYKRLELEIETKLASIESISFISSIHMNQISTLRGLEKLSGKFEKDVVSPTMFGLKELNIYNRLPHVINSEALITSFPNLRHVFLNSAWDTKQLLPFIRQLPKLKELYIYDILHSDRIDLFALNQQRKNLAEACKLTIHLHEYAYLKTKTAKKNLYINHHLIEIKRLVQTNTHTEHCF